MPPPPLRVPRVQRSRPGKARLQTLLASLPKLNTSPFPLSPSPALPQFAKLAPELKDQIWAALCGLTPPRNIYLSFEDIGHSWRGPAYTLHTQYDMKKSKAPVVLQINRASRAEALRFFTKCTLVNHQAGRVLYVNFDIDRFVHPGPSQIYWGGVRLGLYNMDATDMAKIKLLDMEFQYHNAPERFKFSSNMLFLDVLKVTQLREFTLLMMGQGGGTDNLGREVNALHRSEIETSMSTFVQDLRTDARMQILVPNFQNTAVLGLTWVEYGEVDFVPGAPWPARGLDGALRRRLLW